jgi:hypothetical protein
MMNSAKVCHINFKCRHNLKEKRLSKLLKFYLEKKLNVKIYANISVIFIKGYNFSIVVGDESKCLINT